MEYVCSVLLSDGQSGAAMRRDMRETEENSLLNSQVLETEAHILKQCINCKNGTHLHFLKISLIKFYNKTQKKGSFFKESCK